jgi:uncharacterized membrane protein
MVINISCGELSGAGETFMRRRHIQDIMHKHRAKLAALTGYDARLDKLCEISVTEQVVSVGETTVVERCGSIVIGREPTRSKSRTHFLQTQ